MAIKTKNGRKHQIWYFDQKSLTIKSQQYNKSFNIASSGKSNKM